MAWEICQPNLCVSWLKVFLSKVFMYLTQPGIIWSIPNARYAIKRTIIILEIGTWTYNIETNSCSALLGLFYNHLEQNGPNVYPSLKILFNLVWNLDLIFPNVCVRFDRSTLICCCFLRKRVKELLYGC